MIPLSLAAYIPALLIGFSVVTLFYPAALRKHLLLKTFLGAGAGLGITSCLFFFWSVFLSPADKSFLILELFLLAVLTTLNIRRIVRQRGKIGNLELSIKSINWLALAFILLLGSMVFLWLMSYRYYSFMFPHGTFDAYAIWNLKARMIVRGGVGWQESLSPLLNWKNHADYPLLTSANIARAWILIGQETTRVPIVQSGLFTLSTIGVLFAATSYFRNFSQAAIASLALLATPWIPFYAATQNAAIPVAFYYLSTIIGVTLYTRYKHPAFLGLAGLMAGFSLWTKNEGFVFTLAAIIGCIYLLRGQSIKRLLIKLSPFLAGLALPLITVLYFKFQLAPPNDLFADQGIAQVIQRVFSLERYGSILKVFADLIFNLGEWEKLIIPALLGYMLILYRKPDRSTPELFPAVIILSITLLGYFAIYLITPHDLEWHLTYSADRLLFHLYPAFVWLIFLTAKTPEEILGIRSREFTSSEKIP